LWLLVVVGVESAVEQLMAALGVVVLGDSAPEQG
jgi:hypothetical protein